MAETYVLGTANLKPQSDSETGCVSFDPLAFQACRQAYFLKQQNQILLQQQASGKLKDENTMTQVQPTTTAMVASSSYPQINESGNMIMFSLILIIVILVTVMVTRHFSKK